MFLFKPKLEINKKIDGKNSAERDDTYLKIGTSG